jgi:hypothetical protein
MPRVHQTTPFRRPTGSWSSENPRDPAEVGTAFGLELCLEGKQPAHDATAGEAVTKTAGDNEPSADEPAPPPLCP